MRHPVKLLESVVAPAGQGEPEGMGAYVGPWGEPNFQADYKLWNAHAEHKENKIIGCYS